MTRIGELRHRIEIQTRTKGPTGTSTLTDVFATTMTVWAKISTMKGTNRFEALGVGANQDAGPTHYVTLRNRSGIDAQKWIKFDGRRFRIHDVKNVDEAGEFLDLIVEEMRDAV